MPPCPLLRSLPLTESLRSWVTRRSWLPSLDTMLPSGSGSSMGNSTGTTMAGRARVSRSANNRETITQLNYSFTLNSLNASSGKKCLHSEVALYLQHGTPESLSHHLNSTSLTNHSKMPLLLLNLSFRYKHQLYPWLYQTSKASAIKLPHLFCFQMWPSQVVTEIWCEYRGRERAFWDLRSGMLQWKLVKSSACCL